MITGYRIVKAKWLDTAFDGQGAKRYGGRWNSKGRSCVYLSSSISLGLLEVMAHINDYSILPHYRVLEVQFESTDLLRLPDDVVPEDWKTDPASLSTAEIGDQWLDSKESAVLAVPGVVVPKEQNYLVNPGHAKFGQIVTSAQEIDYQLDERLIKRRNLD